MSNRTLNYEEIHRDDKKLGHFQVAGTVRRERIRSSRKMFMSTLQGVNADCEIAFSSPLAFGTLVMFVLPSCKPSFHVKHVKACFCMRFAKCCWKISFLSCLQL